MRRTLCALTLGLFLLGCAASPEGAQQSAESDSPGLCSWFGARRENTLFFGVSSFWDRQRQGGAQSALGQPDRAMIGRFDLRTEMLLPPLILKEGPTRGGVWDVLALPDGRVVYTALAGHAGWIEPESRIEGRLGGTGTGANELAALPGNRLAMTQYFEGSVLVFDEHGELEKRITLPSREGERVAPKSLAFDASRGREGWIWLNTDLFVAAQTARHDARAVDLATGDQVFSVSTPELHTLVFGNNGTGFLVWSDPEGLALQILPAGVDPKGESTALLRLVSDFHSELDFAQDIAIAPTGEVLITLWSGRVFVVDKERRVRSVTLPRQPPGSLFYSAALRGTRVCATRCGEIAVVCGELL